MATISKHAHHITPIKVYIIIGAILLILTAVTVEVSFYDFGAFNMVVALTIASLKAVLVAFFFMHLWYDNKLFFVAFAVGLLLLTVFITFTMFDTLDRGAINPESRGPINPRAAMYDSPHFDKQAAVDGSSYLSDTTAVGQNADTVTTGQLPAESE